MVAQGAKRILLGEDVYVYDAYHFLITSVDLPIMAQVIEASKEKPYLGLMLKLDLKSVSQLLVDSNLPSSFPGVDRHEPAARHQEPGPGRYPIDSFSDRERPPYGCGCFKNHA